MCSTTITISFLIFSFLLLFTPSLSAPPPPPQPSTPVPPSTACNATLDPSFCRSVLPSRGSQNLYSYSRFSLAKSLGNAYKFLNLINHYLSPRRASKLSPTAVAALQDCRLLSGLNIDFLTSAGATLNATNALLDPQADQVQTLLSALMTNQQTCLDSIQAAASAWSVKKGLAVPISNSTKLYSISLALFTKAWVAPKSKKPKPRKGLTPSRLPTRRSLLFHEVV